MDGIKDCGSYRILEQKQVLMAYKPLNLTIKVKK